MNKGIVLSVDDDERLQIVLKQYLEGEGYKVITASSGAQLSEKLDSRSDVILLDLVLPDTDGISLISQIRTKSRTPIIVVSGKSDTMEKVVCLEMGADDYITKPFEMRELSARIKAALRRAPDPAANESVSVEDKKSKIEFGGFVLDRDQFQLFNAKGKSLELTTGEFQMLEALALAPNRALSRERLFEITRDSTYDSFDRAIDIQIGRIRKKLGANGDSLIKTVRGVGYMFCPPSA